jgi:hypothetical protein
MTPLVKVDRSRNGHEYCEVPPHGGSERHKNVSTIGLATPNPARKGPMVRNDTRLGRIGGSDRGERRAEFKLLPACRSPWGEAAALWPGTFPPEPDS